jgi:uncharacterized protein YaiI (UPF0178 family)
MEGKREKVKIYVDADSCPVKEEVIRVANRHNLDTYMVSNTWLLRVDAAPNIHRVMVEPGADKADNWIVDNVTEGDIVITADILLAERCLKKNTKVLNPNGKLFNNDNIGMAIAMRELTAHLRETGEISGHNPSFTKQNRSLFLQELEMLISRFKH